MGTQDALGTARLSPLSEDLVAEKRAFVEDLRMLFCRLGVGVRRYAARRHVDASTLTRYLKGDRLPAWDFVATLMADLREDGVALTLEAEQRMRELHRDALQSNKPASKKQKLEDQLALADEEARRKQAHAQALEEALLDRMQRLSQAEARCRDLAIELDQQAQAHRAELDLWQGEYEQLGRECDDLQQEITYLKEVLAVTQAELIAAEDQCCMLESQLETVQELWQEAAVVPSLMAALEATDRTASVPELVDVVSDLESRTQRAMASELVTSVSRSRPVYEVAALLAGLDGAGLGAHAQAALPVLVLTRPVGDLGRLAAELERSRLISLGARLLQASVRLHTPGDTAAFAIALHREHLPEHVAVLLGAFLATREVPQVLEAVDLLATGPVAAALPQALRAAASERPVSDIVELSHGLGENGWDGLTYALQAEAVSVRPATDVTELIDSLSCRGLLRDADFVFDNAQSCTSGHLVALVSALRVVRNHAASAAVLDRAALTRAPGDVATLINDLHATGNGTLACDVLIVSAARRAPDDFLAVLRALDERHCEVHWVLEHAAGVTSPSDAALLFRTLNDVALPSHAETVLASTLENRPTGHAGQFLTILHHGDAPELTTEALLERARMMPPAMVAPLVLALASANLRSQLDAVLRGGGAERDGGEIAILLKQITFADSPIAPLQGHVFDRLTHVCLSLLPAETLADHVLALEEASLNWHAATLTQRAGAHHLSAFTSVLKRLRTKDEQRVFSRRFWTAEHASGLHSGRTSGATPVALPGRRGQHRRGR
ncbi:hypothetical protein ABT300_21875 [Streptomyces sp. NPDC001027]|uniref:hypothetical protein n=1 Tax=Streptomyces sp. NPDC001027 TaxID=3154771 RepID=UPI003333AA7C